MLKIRKHVCDKCDGFFFVDCESNQFAGICPYCGEFLRPFVSPREAYTAEVCDE